MLYCGCNLKWDMFIVMVPVWDVYWTSGYKKKKDFCQTRGHPEQIWRRYC